MKRPATNVDICTVCTYTVLKLTFHKVFFARLLMNDNSYCILAVDQRCPPSACGHFFARQDFSECLQSLFQK
jgi:hypothetical protein